MVAIFVANLSISRIKMSVHIKLHKRYADKSGINPNRNQPGFIDANFVAKLLQQRIK